MKKYNLIVVFALLCFVRAGAYAPGSIQKSHPDSASWDDLFKPDLSNAVYSPGIWMMVDGELSASQDECIWTKEQYENFILDFNFKMGAAANSGVIVYCADLKDWIPNSVEIQILDDYAEKWKDVAATWKCGGLFGHLAPSAQTVKKAGEWNRMTVTCRGPQIEVLLNGEVVVQADIKKWTSAKTNPDGSEIPAWLSRPMAELQTKGHIGLQGKHGGAPIFFRQVKIKGLSRAS
jgi:hypothetical protein